MVWGLIIVKNIFLTRATLGGKEYFVTSGETECNEVKLLGEK